MTAPTKYKVIIAGGGTGGHVFPAIAIADRLQQQYDEQIDILFVGAVGKLEMTKVPEAGYEIVGLPIAGFQRRFTLKNLLFPFKLLYSLVRAFAVVTRFKPDVVIGVGGYASGPPMYAASLRGIPTVIQEQNSYPGVTNKLLAKRASRVCVAYDGMERFFGSDKVVLTGNPVRKEIAEPPIPEDKAKAFFGLDPGKPMILAIGGSLGARTINDSLFAHLDLLFENDYQLLWQCGKLYHEDLARKINQTAHPHVRLVPFIRRMEVAYAAADVIVSRAGALSISELCLVGKPVILVPSPNVTEDHQTKNARALSDAGAALMIADADAVQQLVPAAVQLLGDADQRKSLSLSIRGLARPDATTTIIEQIAELLPA